MAVQRVQDLFAGLLELFRSLHVVGLQITGAEVRGHDQNRVLEIHDAAFAIGEAAVVHHLEQDVENVRMRLLDFVEQHDRVRTAADLLGELASFFIADIARRRAD